MVIVSLSRKDSTAKAPQRHTYRTKKVNDLIDYINRHDNGMVVIHPDILPFDAPEQAKALFAENLQLLTPRKDSNILYHEYISFAASDSDHLTSEILQDIAEKYRELRAPHALCYAKAHGNTKTPHIHFAFTANDFGHRRRLRLSTKEFAAIKRKMEQYQRDRYPQLTNSRVDHDRGRVQDRPSRAEQAVEKKQPSRKQQLQDLLQQLLLVSDTEDALIDQLRNHDLELYQRGKHHGVKDLNTQRKYRLHTLGLVEILEKARTRWAKTADRSEPDLVSTDEALSKGSDDEIVLEHGVDKSDRGDQVNDDVGKVLTRAVDEVGEKPSSADMTSPPSFDKKEASSLANIRLPLRRIRSLIRDGVMRVMTLTPWRFRKRRNRQRRIGAI